MTTDTTTRRLTKMDVRALNEATSIAYDHLANGTGAIRAIRDEGEGATGTWTIPVESYVRVYDNPAKFTTFTGYHLEFHPRFSNTVQTLLRHLKAGSVVALEWTYGNASPVLNDVGFVRDELRIKIAGNMRNDTYLVAVQVGRDNTARMIRGVS